MSLCKAAEEASSLQETLVPAPCLSTVVGGQEEVSPTDSALQHQQQQHNETETSEGGNPSGVLWGGNPANTDSQYQAQKRKSRSDFCSRNVFSISGGGYAWPSLRNKMKQDGDIEENPGPACHVCGRTIAANNKPLFCATCARGAHGSCTGLSRAEIRREVVYSCSECGPMEGRAEQCPSCLTPIRHGSGAVQCCGCGRRAHAACTGLTREQVRRGTPYTCTGCAGGGADVPVARIARSGDRCAVCGAALRGGARCVVCGGCDAKSHKKCAGAAGRLGTWMCRECAAPEEEPGRAEPEREVQITAP